MVRAAIVMPILGHLILLNKYAVDFVELDPRFVIFAGAPSWRLVALYYGFFIVGLAAFIYQIACPEQIRKYPSAVEYANAEKNYFGSNLHHEYLERQTSGAPYSMGKRQLQRLGLRHPYQSPIDSAFSKTRLTLVEMISTHWHQLDTSRDRLCYTAALLYGLGFVVLAIPAAATLLEVSAFVVRQAW